MTYPILNKSLKQKKRPQQAKTRWNLDFIQNLKKSKALRTYK